VSISDGANILAEDLLNRKSYSNDTNISPGRDKKIYVHISNTKGEKKVFLYLYGEQANQALLTHFHNVGSLGSDAIGNCTGTGGGNACGHNHTISGSVAVNTSTFVNGSYVPKFVQIWIDGTQYTATIGDPNGKGATMYTGGSGWGVNGSTIWNTGKLDLSSLISWTVGEHYIEFKETGNFGGRLLYDLYVNCES
jgi:hypothetical protein